MAITASLVKELRERTGAGMMECKKALVAVDGDIEKAIDEMRKSGLAQAGKKAGRIAADGTVRVEIAEDGSNATILEVNSETDFVAKGDDFIAFVDTTMAAIKSENPADVDALSACGGKTGSIEEDRQALISKIGENIKLRRFESMQSAGVIGSYSHGNRIGVLVNLEGGDENLAKDIAMHIAASRPVCVSAAEVPAETLQREKDVLVAQAKESGKPDNIIEKMVEGRMHKFLAEITLNGQAFVKDPDQTVEKLLKANNAKVASFIRYEVGEGIEKKVENFAEEVAAQAKGS